MRTIDELDASDQLYRKHCTVSDVLAFCIVAGDWLRAKRRRYPLGLILQPRESLSEENKSDDATFNSTNIMLTSTRVTHSYFPLKSLETTRKTILLWDYSKEYVDD